MLLPPLATNIIYLPIDTLNIQDKHVNWNPNKLVIWPLWNKLLSRNKTSQHQDDLPSLNHHSARWITITMFVIRIIDLDKHWVWLEYIHTVYLVYLPTTIMMSSTTAIEPVTQSHTDDIPGVSCATDVTDVTERVVVSGFDCRHCGHSEI